MRFEQKRRRRNKHTTFKYCYIAYTTEDIKRIYFDECKNVDEALTLFEKNVARYCRQNGYYRNEYLTACYNGVFRRIKELWNQ